MAFCKLLCLLKKFYLTDLNIFTVWERLQKTHETSDRIHLYQQVLKTNVLSITLKWNTKIYIKNVTYNRVIFSNNVKHAVHYNKKKHVLIKFYNNVSHIKMRYCINVWTIEQNRLDFYNIMHTKFISCHLNKRNVCNYTHTWAYSVRALFVSCAKRFERNSAGYCKDSIRSSCISLQTYGCKVNKKTLCT